MRKFKTLIGAILIFAIDIALQKGKLDVLTAIFIGVFFLMILVETFVCRNKMLKISKDLRETRQKLSKLSVEKINSSDHLPDILFKSNYLNKLYSEYLKAYREDSVTGKRNADITDYINESSINGYIKKSFSDLFPGTMTALGILGTFIGLTIGLQKFDIGGNTLDLNTNIAGLTDGIKIAFHTSIIGVFLSVVYNFIYSHDISEMQTELYEFYNAFDRIVPSAQEEIANKLLTYQEKQTDALLKLSDNISAGISDRMAEAIEKTINPAMDNVAQKINDVIVEVKDTLNTYIQGTVESQTETMQKIVDKFMQTLNKSMNDQFKALSQAIDEMCKWQGVTTDNIKEINLLMTPLVEELGKQNRLCNDNNNISTILFRKTELLIDNLKDYSDESAEYMRAAHSYIEQLAKLNIETKENFERISDSVKYSEEAFSKITELMTIINKERKETEEYQNNLEIRTHSMDETLKMIIQKMTDYLKGIAELDEVYKKLINNANEICKKISEESGEIRNEFSSEIAEINEASKKSFEQLSKFIDDLKNDQEFALKSTRESVRDIKISLINVLKNITNSNNLQNNKEEDDK